MKASSLIRGILFCAEKSTKVFRRTSKALDRRCGFGKDGKKYLKRKNIRTLGIIILFISVLLTIVRLSEETRD
jgi:hypothetical protein